MCIMGCFRALIVAIALGTALACHAQEISFQLTDAPVAKFLDLLQKQSGYVVILIQPVFPDHPRVTISADHQPLEKILRQVLTPLGAEFALIEKNIVIREMAQGFSVNSNSSRIITGRIVDTLGNSIPNATIRIKFDNLAGTISDREGRFRLRPGEKAGQELVVSSVGYQTVELTIHRPESFFLIPLKEDIGALDKAQVTAYGETTNKLSTAGSQTITGVRLAQYPIDNALDAVQDLSTGVFVQRQSGVSGSAYSTHIRGVNSLTGVVNTESQPLIIVDGVAYPGSVLPFLQGLAPETQIGGNGLNYLLPDMIETITVLKDADALSIYGSRGAYGVILIKTKSGRSHSSGISFKEEAGVNEPGTLPHLMNTGQYLTIRREALANDGVMPGLRDLDVNGTWSQQRYINWPRYFYKSRSGLSDSYLTWNDGSDLLSWSVGGGFRYDGGLLVNGGGAKTGGLHYNVNAFQNKKLSLVVLGVYTHTDNNNTPFDPLGYSNAARSIESAPNAPPALNPDGSINWATGIPATQAAAIRTVYLNKTNNSVTGATLSYKPVGKLAIKIGFGYNALTGDELWGTPSTVYAPGSAATIQSTQNQYKVDTWTLEPNANFSTPLFGNLLSVTVGGTAQEIKNFSYALSGTDLANNNNLANPASASPANQMLDVIGEDKRYLGFFGLINYNWQEKYILNLGLRRDGSSVFGTAEQFGNFYSVGAAYLVGSEPWFKKLLPLANFAKLRGSYGTVGGDNITPGQADATFGSGYNFYQGNPGLIATRLQDPYLHWEMDRKWNAALELHFFNDRVSMEVEYYHTHVYDQLVGRSLSYVTGFAGLYTNDNSTILTGYGWEGSFRTLNLRRKKWKWTTEIRFSLPRNILTTYPSLAAVGSTAYQIGKSVEGLLVFDYKGVNPQDGRQLFKNASGQVGEVLYGNSQQLGLQDRTKFINLAPIWFGSVINTFSFGRWELDIVAGFTQRIGLNYLGSTFGSPGEFDINFPKEVLARWQKPGDRTNIPRASAGPSSLLSWFDFVQSTGAYSHAGYCRLDNLYLAYRLPASLLKHWYNGDLTLFLQGGNLLTVSKYHDYDPANLGVSMPPEKRLAGGVKMDL